MPADGPAYQFCEDDYGPIYRFYEENCLADLQQCIEIARGYPDHVSLTMTPEGLITSVGLHEIPGPCRVIKNGRTVVVAWQGDVINFSYTIHYGLKESTRGIDEVSHLTSELIKACGR